MTTDRFLKPKYSERKKVNQQMQSRKKLLDGSMADE